MNKMLSFFITLIVLVCPISVIFAAGVPVKKYDIYCLVAGSGHYKQSSNNRLEAINSANSVSDIIQSINGGRPCKKIVSSENKFLTPEDIDNAIYDLKQSIRMDKPNNPLVIIYYMGHGLSDNYGFHHYLALGNYDFPEKPINTFVPLEEKGILESDALALTLYQFSLDEKDRYLDEQVRLNGKGKESMDNFKKDRHSLEETREFFKRNMNLDILESEAMLGNAKKQAQLLKGFNWNESQIKKLAGVGVDLKKDNKPLLKESRQLSQHVPYLIMLDSCSNGLGDPMHQVLADEQIKVMEAYGKMNAQSIKGMFGEPIRKYGSLIFAANPGSNSQASQSANDRFALNQNKVGRLAKRLELSVNQIQTSDKDASVGEFIDMFYSSLKNEKNMPDPFTWFDLPDDMKKHIFIQRLH